MKKKIENINDLIEIRDLLLEREKNILKILTYQGEPATDKTEETKLFSTLDAVKKSLDKTDRIASKIATFETPLFANFIATLLTLTEKEKYISVGLNLPDEDTGFIIATNNYYLVCDEGLADFAAKTIESERQILALQRTIKNRYLLVMNKERTFPLDYYLKVNPKFSVFPQLEEAIYKLVDLGIKNPELSEEERMSTILRETLFKNISKSNGFSK
ncbi:MAG: hypothetical protein IJI22_03300 [Bacilli bacterium]|nr:hypothetical protein [Bacilli bacterium]